MKKQKIFERIAYISIGLSILVIIGLTIFQQCQIRKLNQGVDSEAAIDFGTSDGTVSDQPVNHTGGTQTYPSDKGKSIDKTKINDLNTSVDQAEIRPDEEYSQLSEEITEDAENAKIQREVYRKMTEEPSFKAGVRESMRKTNETLYGPLFKVLDLSPDKLENLKNLLADYQADIIVISQGTLSVSTEEEKTELQKRYDETEKDYKSRFNDLLGSKDYVTYQAYQDRLNDKYIVNMFMESLVQEEKLSEDQQQTLVEALYNERKTVYSKIDYNPKQLEPIIFMNDDSIARRMKVTEEIHSRALKNAKKSLSASQYERLKEYLKQQRELEEESLKLAVQQFGGTSSK